MEFGSIFRTEKKRALSISEKARSMTVPSLMPPERIIFFLPGGTSSHAERITVPASSQIICHIVIRFCGCSMDSARLSRNRCTQYHPPRGGRC